MIDITLATINGGGLEERFQDELRKVIKNIQDPNTDAEGKRQINIAVTIQPVKGNRDICGYVASCSSKLGKDSPLEGFITNGVDPITGEVEAQEHKPRQQTIFETPTQKALRENLQTLASKEN